MALNPIAEAYINAVLAALNAASAGGKEITLYLPTGEVHIVNGQWKMFPNGAPRDVTFEPKVGMKNLTQTTPAEPIVESPSQVKLPAETGLRLGSVVGTASTVAMIWQIGEWIREFGLEDDLELARRKKLDVEIIGFIVFWPDSEIEPLRMPVPNPDRRRRQRQHGQKRVRIHGYSRRPA